MFMNEEWKDSSTLALYTDASGTEGFGGIYGTKWFQERQLKALVLTGRSCMPSLSPVQYGGASWSQKRTIFGVTTNLW